MLSIVVLVKLLIGYDAASDTVCKYSHQSKLPSSKKIAAKELCSRCLSKFIDWRVEIQSVKLVFFDSVLWTVVPLNFSEVQLSPTPPFPMWISIIIHVMYSLCGWGYGVLGLTQINTCLKVPLQVNLFRWRHFALPSMSLIFLHPPHTHPCWPVPPPRWDTTQIPYIGSGGKKPLHKRRILGQREANSGTRQKLGKVSPEYRVQYNRESGTLVSNILYIVESGVIIICIYVS